MEMTQDNDRRELKRDGLSGVFDAEALTLTSLERLDETPGIEDDELAVTDSETRKLVLTMPKGEALDNLLRERIKAIGKTMNFNEEAVRREKCKKNEKALELAKAVHEAVCPFAEGAEGAAEAYEPGGPAVN